VRNYECKGADRSMDGVEKCRRRIVNGCKDKEEEKKKRKKRRLFITVFRLSHSSIPPMDH